MSKNEGRDRGADMSKGQLARRRKYGHLVVLLLVFGAIVAGGLYLLSGRQSGAKEDMARLQGRWLRPDGGYVIEIKDVDAKGQMTAAYYNPRPINVFRAEASQAGAEIKVFIELRDVNYPGATYNLAYDPKSDQFRGVYYQPALKQSFDVVFVRMK